jgi:filamentous hemagglutinin family protein
MRPSICRLLTPRSRLAAGVGVAALLAGAAQALPTPVGGTYPVNAGGGQPVITNDGDSSVFVDLNAQRTIIDWSNFDLLDHEGVTFAFGQRNWVVLNRVTSGPINIDGQILGIHSATITTGAPVGGNVWFYSPAGVAFGPNARVDVGGLLATSAAADTTAFLNTANLNMPFTGSGSGGPVTIAGGAQFQGAGHLAFVAPRVTSAAGAVVNAGDLGTAAYGGVDSYEIQFIPIGANDLAFFTFLVPSAAAGTPFSEALNLAGQTTGANVYLIAMSRAALTSTLINAPGLLVGASSEVRYGQVTISTGRNIVLGQVGAGSEAQQVAGVTTGSIRVGEIDAAGNVNLYLTGTGSLGDLTAERVRSGQGLSIAAHNITIGPGGLSSGDRGVLVQNTFIDTAGTVIIPQITSRTHINLQRATAQIGRTTSLPEYRLGTLNAGGSILVGNGSRVDITSLTAAADAQVFGLLPVTIGTMTTGGYTRISSEQTINANLVQGAELDLRSAMGVTATSLIGSTSVRVGTGGPAIIDSITGPTLNLEAITARLGTVSISGAAVVRTRDLHLLGGFTARALTLEMTTPTGPLRLGGATGISEAEIGRITVSENLTIYAGQTTTTINEPVLRFSDIEVGDLTIDPSQIPRLALFANPGHELRIAGMLRPLESGGELQLGNGDVGSAWAPGAIIVTGSIGSASGDALTGFTDVHAFEGVALHATDDILMGSSRFIDLVSPVPAAEIDIGRGLPLGVAATTEEQGRLFLVAGNLTLTASDRIVQQNTGAIGTEGGLYLTGDGVEPDEPLLVVGRAQVGDLFGAFASSDGVLTIGSAGAFSSRIAREPDDASAGAIRINGCPLGIGCAVFTPANQFRVEQFRPAALRVAVDPPVLTPPPTPAEDDRETEAITTGAGNEEIWRRDR